MSVSGSMFAAEIITRSRSEGVSFHPMKRFHVVFGLSVLMVFLLTGQYMDWYHQQLMYMADGPRMLCRTHFHPHVRIATRRSWHLLLLGPNGDTSRVTDQCHINAASSLCSLCAVEPASSSIVGRSLVNRPSSSSNRIRSKRASTALLNSRSSSSGAATSFAGT